MRRVFAFRIIVCFIVLIAIGCQNQNEEEGQMELNLEEFQEMRERGVVYQGQYAHFMRFENHLVWDRTNWSQFERYGDREIIFVHSEEAAADFGLTLDVIVGWPSLYSQGIMEGINNTEGLDLEAVGLSSPLTMEDLVYNWEQVNTLINRIDHITLREIEGYARRSRGSSDDWLIRRWLFPEALDELNRLLEGRNISEVDFTRFNESHDRELTIDDLPTWPITEEDVRNDPWLIWEIASNLLTDEEVRRLEPESLLRAQQDIENE